MKTIAEIIEVQSCDLRGMFDRYQMTGFRQLEDFKRTIQLSLEYHGETVDMDERFIANVLPININILSLIASELFNLEFSNKPLSKNKVSPSITVKQKDIDTMLKTYNIDVVTESIKLIAKLFAREIMNEIIEAYHDDYKQFDEEVIPSFNKMEVLVISDYKWLKRKCPLLGDRNGYELGLFADEKDYELGIFADKKVIFSSHLPHGTYFIVNETNRVTLNMFNLCLPLMNETDSETQIKYLSNYEIIKANTENVTTSN